MKWKKAQVMKKETHNTVRMNSVLDQVGPEFYFLLAWLEKETAPGLGMRKERALG